MNGTVPSDATSVYASLLERIRKFRNHPPTTSTLRPPVQLSADLHPARIKALLPISAEDQRSEKHPFLSVLLKSLPAIVIICLSATFIIFSIFQIQKRQLSNAQAIAEKQIGGQKFSYETSEQNLTDTTAISSAWKAIQDAGYPSGTLQILTSNSTPGTPLHPEDFFQRLDYDNGFCLFQSSDTPSRLVKVKLTRIGSAVHARILDPSK